MSIELQGFTVKQLPDGRYYAKNVEQDLEFIVDDLKELSEAVLGTKTDTVE